MSSSKDILASLILAAKQNNGHPDIAKALLEMKERHPILLALSKWLNKINTGIQTPEAIKEQNNKIFAAFLFLLDHDYLFYLTITKQTELIKQFFEVNSKKLPVEEEDLLVKIRKEYEQALENNVLLRLQASSIQKTSADTNLSRYYFLPQSHQSFEIYCYVEREYQLLKYEYRIEQVKAFREVFNEEANALINEVAENTELPQDIKDDVMDDLKYYLSEFEDELLEVETILENHPLKDELHTITPEMYAKLAKQLPPIPKPESTVDALDSLDDIDGIDLDEEELDSELLSKSEDSSVNDAPIPPSRKSLNESELVLSPQDILIHRDELPHSKESVSGSEHEPHLEEAPITPQHKDSLVQDEPTVPKVSTTQPTYPTPEVADIALLHKVSNLREKWENVGKAFINPETGRLRHDSLHQAYMRHKKSITQLDMMLENLRQKYTPSIIHLEQEVNRAQQIAINDIKVDLHRFADLLSQNELESDENQEKVNLYITNLANFVIRLDNMTNSENIQDALAEHLNELNKIEALFQGELQQFAPQYELIKEQLKKQIDLKLPDSGVVINPESLPQPQPQPIEQPTPPKPVYRKFVGHLATFHEQKRLLHQKKMPGIVEEQSSIKMPKSISEESTQQLSLNSDMELRLKNLIKTTQMFLTRCINTAKSEGSDISSLDAINILVVKIKETQFKTVDLKDLIELAEKLEAQPSNFSIHSFASNYKELEADIRAHGPSVQRSM